MTTTASKYRLRWSLWGYWYARREPRSGIPDQVIAVGRDDAGVGELDWLQVPSSPHAVIIFRMTQRISARDGRRRVPVNGSELGQRT